MNLILYGAELRWCEGINQYNNSVIFCGMIKFLCLFVFMSFLIFFFFFFVFLKICSISWSFLSVKHETCGRNVWGCWPPSWGECRRGARRRGRCRSRSSSRRSRCRSKHGINVSTGKKKWSVVKVGVVKKRRGWQSPHSRSSSQRSRCRSTKLSTLKKFYNWQHQFIKEQVVLVQEVLLNESMSL